MDELSTLAQTHLHPILNHFPIVLLITSVALELWGRWDASMRRSAWLALAGGTLMAIPTLITGVIAHIPYEDTEAIAAISRHEQLALLTTGIFGALMIWRWRARRRASNPPASWLYLAIGVLGLVVLTLTGLTGGSLVFDLGVGVKEIVR